MNTLMNCRKVGEDELIWEQVVQGNAFDALDEAELMYDRLGWEKRWTRYSNAFNRSLTLFVGPCGEWEYVEIEEQA